PDAIQDVLIDTRGRIDKAQAALRAINTDVPESQQRKIRAQQVATRVQEQIDVALGKHEGYVAFVSGSPDHGRLEIAPLDVGPVLAAGVWAKRTAILTSATLPATLGNRVGLVPGSYSQIDVGSPFDYRTNALLYCAVHLPDPRSAQFAAWRAYGLARLTQAA